MDDINKNKLYRLLNKCFESNVSYNGFEKLKLGDIKMWDSAGNLELLLMVEEEFKITFELEEMSVVKSIHQIINILNDHDIG